MKRLFNTPSKGSRFSELDNLKNYVFLFITFTGGEQPCESK